MSFHDEAERVAFLADVRRTAIAAKANASAIKDARAELAEAKLARTSTAAALDAAVYALIDEDPLGDVDAAILAAEAELEAAETRLSSARMVYRAAVTTHREMRGEIRQRIHDQRTAMPLFDPKPSPADGDVDQVDAELVDPPLRKHRRRRVAAGRS